MRLGLGEVASRIAQLCLFKIRLRRSVDRSGTSLFAASLVIALGLWAPGCGTTCSQIAADEESFREQLYGSGGNDGPAHLAVWIPAASLEAVAAEQFLALGAFKVPTGNLGALASHLGAKVGALQLAPKSLELGPAGGGSQPGLAATLRVALVAGNASLGDFRLTVALDPKVDPTGGALSIGIGPQALRALAPDWSASTLPDLANQLTAWLPPAARAFVPQGSLVDVASGLLASATDKAWAQLRDQLLAKSPDLATVRLRLGNLPVVGADWDYVGEHVRVGVRTPYRVEPGLNYAQVAQVPARLAAVQLAGGTVAALANEGMRRGLLPSRFTQKGEPNPTGAFTAGLAWQPGSRPLHVHAWRKSDTCLGARLEGKPVLKAESGQLVVGIEDGRIADVSGPPLVELGGWLHGLWGQSIRRAETLAVSGQLGVAGLELRWHLEDAVVKGNVVALMLDVATSRAKKVRQK